MKMERFQFLEVSLRPQKKKTVLSLDFYCGFYRIFISSDRCRIVLIKAKTVTLLSQVIQVSDLKQKSDILKIKLMNLLRI